MTFKKFIKLVKSKNSKILDYTIEDFISNPKIIIPLIILGVILLFILTALYTNIMFMIFAALSILMFVLVIFEVEKG